MNETIQWRNARHESPNDERTVLVCSPDSRDPVWPAYFDGEAWYHTNFGATKITVTFWCEMPEGPIG